jgi:hypothetical protein
MSWEINQVDVGTFFTEVRRTLFGGTLNGDQVEGMENILGYRDQEWSGMCDEELAYLLATTKWETAHTMQPIEEYGSQSYLQSKPYYPWYGRGLVQLTWEDNYKKYGFTRPEQALEWPGALHVAFEGMIFGRFTGKKLGDYITPGQRPTQYQYEECRRIINGTDKKVEIAGLAFKFLDALNKARAAWVPPEVDDRPEEGSPELILPPPEVPPEVPPTDMPTVDNVEPDDGEVMITEEDFTQMLLYVMETNEEVQDLIRKIANDTGRRRG